MTKHFCDLCGQPAAASLPSLRVMFPNMTWNGTNYEGEGVSAVDGTWTPFIEGFVVFDAHLMPKSVRAHHPDLCKECVVMLLGKMAGILK